MTSRFGTFEALNTETLRWAAVSDPERAHGHKLGGQAHGTLQGRRYLDGTLASGSDRMRSLVTFHLLDDGAAAAIFGRQAPEMVVQMALDLALSLRKEAQVPAIAKQTRGYANGK